MRSSLLLVLATGCGIAPYPVTPCTTNTDCREAFGLLATCEQTTGACELGEPIARCSKTLPVDLFEREDAYREHIVVGTVLKGATNRANLQAMELAAIQANTEGGLDGREFALINCDHSEDASYDNADESEALDEVTLWLADVAGVPLILGPGTSGSSVRAFETMGDRDVAIMAFSATSPDLTTLDGATSTAESPGLFWRTAPPDNGQARAIAADLELRGVSRIFLLHQSGPYGTALADLVASSFSGSVDRTTYSNDNELTVGIRGAAESSEEVLFISSDKADVIAFLDAAAQHPDDAFDGRALFFADAAGDATIFDDLSDEALPYWFQARISSPATPSGDQYTDFLIAYAAEYSGQQASLDRWNSFAFDATWLSFAGIAWATEQGESVTGTEIARGFRQVSDASGVETEVGPLGWQTVQEQAASASAYRLRGATGYLDFDAVTGERSAPTDILVPNASGDFDIVRTCEWDGRCDP